jgi:hypothetical protein
MTKERASASNENEALSDDTGLKRQLTEGEKWQHDLEESGWVWRGENPIERCLCHPDDPDVYAWFDPYTGEPGLSPKLAEQLTRIVQENRKSRRTAHA